MKLGLVADVHGNAVAFQAVLDELDEEGIDDVVCVGSVAAPGPQPTAALDSIRGRDVTFVRGAADASLLDNGLSAGADDDAELTPPAAIERWCREQLRDSDITLLRDANGRVEFETDDGLTVACLPGEAGSRVPDLTPETPADDIAALLATTDATLLVGGATHEPMTRRVGERMVVNPGSVGNPYEYRADGPVTLPWAEYAVASGDSSSLRVEFRRTPVDRASLEAAARDSGMPHADWWLAGGA